MRSEQQGHILDDRAFERAVLEYKERIFLVILRFVRNREDAKDLTQEAFVKAYRSRAQFRGESSLYTWIYRIAVNLALNYRTRGKMSLFSSIDDSPEIVSPESPSDGMLSQELRGRIDSAILKLPARQRMVFLMRYYDEMPHAEIARTLGITEGAVKANYHQAIKKLKNELGQYVKDGAR
jgi:RNA polymerase sigma-70 factor (ECF subfamily)